jgi:hypothetical protein|tara:strand:+ start:96 stop:203 length:108 start_codon:yes stop_codon:yes gene_type:complete
MEDDEPFEIEFKKKYKVLNTKEDNVTSIKGKKKEK